MIRSSSQRSKPHAACVAHPPAGCAARKTTSWLCACGSSVCCLGHGQPKFGLVRPMFSAKRLLNAALESDLQKQHMGNMANKLNIIKHCQTAVNAAFHSWSTGCQPTAAHLQLRNAVTEAKFFCLKVSAVFPLATGLSRSTRSSQMFALHKRAAIQQIPPVPSLAGPVAPHGPVFVSLGAHDTIA